MFLLSSQYTELVSANFDTQLNLIKIKWSEQILSQGYLWPMNITYSQVTHPLRDSTLYAMGLLYSNEEEKIKTANRILEIILDCQDKNPSSSNYGLWAHNYEDDISSIQNPDANFTTYIGVPLFVILCEYSHLLSPQICADIVSSLILACFYILHRNIHLQYTNIVLTESLLTVACGEKFHRPEFLRYGTTLFQKFYHYTVGQGEFFEYNTPIYDCQNIQFLYSMCHHIKNAAFSQTANKIYDSLWGVVAKHYHYQTGQFCGPISRADFEFLSPKLTVFYQKACKTSRKTSSILDFEDICPQKYRPYFDGTLCEEYSQKIIHLGCSYPFYRFSQVATTFIQPQYSLGTFNRMEYWLERCSFFVTFGTKKTPFIAKMRVMHDDNDFSSAQSSCVQYKNYAAGHVTFANNGADKHIEFDNTHGSINAKDLRVRFSIKGDISLLKLKQVKKKFTLQFQNTTIQLEYSYSKFDSASGRPELNIEENQCHFDLVLYHGPSKKINLNEIKNAIVSYGFCIYDNEECSFTMSNNLNKNVLTTQMDTAQKINLSLRSLSRPNTTENIHTHNIQCIQGKQLEKYVLESRNLVEQYSYAIEHSLDSPFEIKFDDEYLTNMIHDLANVNEDDLISSIKNIFSLIYKNKLTLQLVKRLSIQILSQVFEIYRNKNIQFETFIQKHSTISQIHISYAPDSETVAYITFDLLKLLHSYYLELSESVDDTNLVNIITQIIEQEYSNPDLSLEYIASKYEKSIYVVSRTFKQITNLKYIDYLTHIRMEHAKELLKNTDQSTDNIAKKVGYLNVSSFMRAFKKHTGYSPNKYRNYTRT